MRRITWALMLALIPLSATAERVPYEQTAEDRAWLQSLLKNAEKSGVRVLVDDGTPVLIGGAPADPKEWPASVYASMSGSRCSATVVGPRTLLIAAHCVSNGGTASFSVGSNRYTSRCTHWDQYRRNSTADLAMCLIDREVVGIPYERMLTEASKLSRDLQVQLSGYGCIRPGGGGGNDGIFRIGTAKVTRLPSGTNYDVVTVGGAALCFGDSGGAAYLWDKLVRQPFEFLLGKSIEMLGELVAVPRYVFGVNSRGDIRQTSYLSNTYGEQPQAFIRGWADRNGQKICGIHPDATGCREAGDPPAPSEFEVDTDVAKGKLKMVEGKEMLLEEAKRVVVDALNSLDEGARRR